ncbi:MAG TPA: DUF2782 domain-containing protein [Gammaproteobacteria bacterium]|nr:DUF2782 domain-containing protein [Candidatus Competibacteraceae bacterium]MCP5132447.1 DUF2782 domain-containing protein [Gammaproteobacteria bacterium]HCB13960.1 DUF2782 domain-containing protein [Gammaproteobacteria bacterium]HPF59765.1 DUF2782 domain-containing protein [Candidatus Competibacteraceae bacterium]HRF44664.1 DUF2782 domain-containing protein [Candidatus Competibacteraceae bacterium]
MRLRLLLPLLLVPGLGMTQDAANPAGLEPIPDGPPDSSREQNVPAPEITIRQLGDQGSVEEYRAGGVLYMVRVNPAKGASYYLVDTDGDGNMETRYNDLQSNLAIPAWVLLRW